MRALKTRMRLLFLAPANSVHSARWIRWFAGAGHEVTWISAHPAEVAIPANVTLHVLPQDAKVTRWPRWLLNVRRIIRAANPEVVHVHSLGTYALLAFGVPNGIPMVATPWGSDIILDANSWWRRAIVRRTLHRSSIYTCDAQHMGPRLVEFGVDAKRIRFINFGIESERFTPLAATRFEKAGPVEPTERLADATPLRVLSLRNLEPVYDVATLIHAAAILDSEKLPVAVSIYGGGSLRAELEALVRERGLEHCVSFGGRYSHETLPGILEAAEVYVSTSTSDAGIAASTAEAMAAGLPVIVSDSGENAIWITDGVNGRLFQVGDAAALAKALAEASQSPAKRRGWAERGMRTVLDRNDYRTEMGKVESLYRSVSGAPHDR